MKVAGFEFPQGLLFHAEHQVWARLEADGTATVGITAMGIGLAGEIYMCRPRALGSEVQQGRGIAVVELAKSIVSVKSPLSGRVLAVNAALEEQPEQVHQDPYGAGWLLRLQPLCLADERLALVQGAAVAAAMQHQAWLNQLPG